MKHTLAWQNGDKVTIKYRDVHAKTLTNDVQYFPPKERVTNGKICPSENSKIKVGKYYKDKANSEIYRKYMFIDGSLY